MAPGRDDMRNHAELFKNYELLLEKVDSLCVKIRSICGDAITCREGCDGCCRHFSVFLVEAVSIALAVGSLPEEKQRFLRRRVEWMKDGDICPLLVDGSCAVYDHRPVICRTHGLPILIREGEEVRVDFCPKNFSGTETLNGDAVIDLERLNQTLAAINEVFVAGFFREDPPSDLRLSMADALMLEI